MQLEASDGIGPRGTGLVIGSQGGVGHALVELLSRHPACVRLVQRLDRLLLLDSRSELPFHGLDDQSGCIQPLAPRRVDSAQALAELIRTHDVDQVIDVSNMATRDCIDVCDLLGADYLSTSVHGWPGCQAPVHVLMREVIPEVRRTRARSSQLIGAGMNPGAVNALALLALERLAGRAGLRGGELEQQLQSVLVTEDDTTASLEPLEDGVLPMSWSPQHALDELLEPRAMVVRRGVVDFLAHAPLGARYRARCGQHMLDGFVVPHEEIISLGRLFSRAELAFLYRPPPGARAALAAHPERTRPEDWRTRRLYPPDVSQLCGSDRVGALACSREHGELWLGFDTGVEAGAKYGTNATQMQVAAGVLAGWASLGQVRGIHFVEELDPQAYVAVLEDVLGPAIEVYDPAAPPCTLADRRRKSISRPAAGSTAARTSSGKLSRSSGNTA